VLQTQVLQHYPDEYVGDEAVGPEGVRVHGFHLDKVLNLPCKVLEALRASLLVFPRQISWVALSGCCAACAVSFYVLSVDDSS